MNLFTLNRLVASAPGFISNILVSWNETRCHWLHPVTWKYIFPTAFAKAFKHQPIRFLWQLMFLCNVHHSKIFYSALVSALENKDNWESQHKKYINSQNTSYLQQLHPIRNPYILLYDINVKVLCYKEHQIHQKTLIYILNVGHTILKD